MLRSILVALRLVRREPVRPVHLARLVFVPGTPGHSTDRWQVVRAGVLVSTHYTQHHASLAARQASV